MTAPDLGRLTKVDIRSIWKNEASDFTPWLALPDNLRLLGDTIGMELEVQAVEKELGRFFADILCKDTSSDRYVIIENQIERDLIPEQLTWYCKDGVRACKVNVRNPAAVLDRGRWLEYQEWLKTRLEAFDKVFRPRVAALDIEA